MIKLQKDYGNIRRLTQKYGQYMKMNRYWELQDLTYPTALHQMWGPQKIIALPVMLVLGDQLPSYPLS